MNLYNLLFNWGNYWLLKYQVKRYSGGNRAISRVCYLDVESSFFVCSTNLRVRDLSLDRREPGRFLSKFLVKWYERMLSLR